MQQHFSNAILASYRKYVHRNYGESKWQEVVASCGVKESWVNDKAQWHDVDFNEKFHRALFQFFPEDTQIGFNVAYELYREPQMQMFTALIGLFLNPETFYASLPEGVKRMNRYSTYEFSVLSRNPFRITGKLIQRPGDLSRVFFNGMMCDVARGATHGCLRAFGIQLVDIKETECVKRGDSQCTQEFTWINQTKFKDYGIWIGSAVIVFGLSFWFVRLVPMSLILGLMASTAITVTRKNFISKKRLQEAFDFQQRTLNDLRETVADKDRLNRTLIEAQLKVSEAISLAAVGEMSFNYVHDMASPTHLLLNYVDEMMRGIREKYPEEKEILKYSTAIQSATNRLEKLQNLFRTVSKRSESKTPVFTDVSQVVKDCIEQFRPFLSQNSIEVITVGVENEKSIEAYEGSVDTVVLNLLQNAVNVLTTCKVRKLTIEITQDDDGVQLKVSDTGPGIPAERLSELWRRFGVSKAEVAASRASRGSGFGLYGIKKCIDQMGGTIDVDTGDAGTSFRIWLSNTLSQKAVRIA